MESYLPSRLPFVPDSLLVGVLGGVGFMCFALVLLLGSACLINYKRNQRHISRENGKGKERGEKEEKNKKEKLTSFSGGSCKTLTLMNCIMNIIIYSKKY